MTDCSHAKIYCAMAGKKKGRNRSFNQWQHCVRDQTLASTAVVVWSQKIPSQKAITPRLNQSPCCSGAKFIISRSCHEQWGLVIILTRMAYIAAGHLIIQASLIVNRICFYNYKLYVSCMCCIIDAVPHAPFPSCLSVIPLNLWGLNTG